MFQVLRINGTHHHGADAWLGENQFQAISHRVTVNDLVNVPGKDLGKLLPYSTIAVGVFTCWIPGLLILSDNW